MKMLSKVDAPRNYTAGILTSLVSGQDAYKAMRKIHKGERLYTGSGLIRSAFGIDKKPKSRLAKIGLGTAGFGVDTLIDPLTYVSFGSNKAALGAKSLISLNDDVAKIGLRNGARLIKKNIGKGVKYFVDPNNVDDVSRLLNVGRIDKIDDLERIVHKLAIKRNVPYKIRTMSRYDIPRLTAAAINIKYSPDIEKHVARLVKDPEKYLKHVNMGKEGIVNIGGKHYGGSILKKLKIPQMTQLAKNKVTRAMNLAQEGKQLTKGDSLLNTFGKTVKTFNAKAFTNRDLRNINKIASSAGEKTQTKLLDKLPDIIYNKETRKFFDKKTIKSFLTARDIKVYGETRPNTLNISKLGVAPRAITMHEIYEPVNKLVEYSINKDMPDIMGIVARTEPEELIKGINKTSGIYKDLYTSAYGAYENAKKVLQSDIMPKEIKLIGANMEAAIANGDVAAYKQSANRLKSVLDKNLLKTKGNVKYYDNLSKYLKSTEKELLNTGQLSMPIATKHGLGYFPHTAINTGKFGTSKAGKEVGFVQLAREHEGTLLENILRDRKRYKAFAPDEVDKYIAKVKSRATRPIENTNTKAEYNILKKVNTLSTKQYAEDIIGLARKAGSSKKISKFGELLTDEYLPFMKKVKSTDETGDMIKKGYMSIEQAMGKIGIKRPDIVLERVGIPKDELGRIFMPNSIAHQMGNMLQLYEHPLEIMKSLSHYTSIWKRYALGSPGTVFRNFVGNVFFLHTRGINMFDQHNIGLGKRAAKIMFGMKSKNPIQLGNIKYTDEQLRHLAEKYGLLGIGRSMETRPSQIEMIQRGGGFGAYKSARDVFAGRKGYLAKVTKAMGDVEDQGHLWAFMWGLDKGYAPEEAARMALDTLFDYNHGITHTERALFSNALIPFYSFTRFNLPRQISLLVKKPKTFSRLYQLKAELEDNSSDKIEEELIPEWLKGRFPIRLGNKNVVVGEGFLPSVDLAKIMPIGKTASTSIEMGNPLIKSIYELLQNKSLYRDVPITTLGASKSPIPFSPVGTYPRAMNYLFESLLRPGKELNYLVRNFSKNDKSLKARGGYPLPSAPMRFAKVAFGFRPYHLDKDKQIKSVIYKMYKERSRLKRELEKGKVLTGWDKSKNKQIILDKLENIDYNIKKLRGDF